MTPLDFFGVDDEGVYHPPSRARHEEREAEIARLRAERDELAISDVPTHCAVAKALGVPVDSDVLEAIAALRAELAATKARDRHLRGNIRGLERRLARVGKTYVVQIDVRDQRIAQLRDGITRIEQMSRVDDRAPNDGDYFTVRSIHRLALALDAARASAPDAEKERST